MHISIMERSRYIKDIVVLELCNMRDGVFHCEYLNSDEICKLLFSICTD